MKVIVTGGAGRLGRSVVAELVAARHSVIVVDKVESTMQGAASVTIDLLDEADTRRCFSEIAPDAVVHLAAIAVPFSAPEGVILSVNQALAYNVFEAGIDAGATRLLAASSPTVIGYGAPHGWAPTSLPITEAQIPRPWNAYALSKLHIENIVAMLARKHGGEIVTGAFRPCFVIAPEEWDGAPTQSGHALAERISNYKLGLPALFNYVDARDAGAFVVKWIEAAAPEHSGAVYFVGAADALSTESLDSLLPRVAPYLDGLSGALTDFKSAFSSELAWHHFAWRAERTWRTEMAASDLLKVTETSASTGATSDWNG